MEEHRERVVSIVDDDESVRRSVRNLLLSVGLRVAVFESAESFLQSAQRGNTGCLVIDLRMPGMGGLDLQSHLTATGRHIPIVFVTGYPDDRLRSTALQSGAVCFLTKPFNEGDLLDGLRSALGEP